MKLGESIHTSRPEYEYLPVLTRAYTVQMVI